jgi:hypothetical protein
MLYYAGHPTFHDDLMQMLDKLLRGIYARVIYVDKVSKQDNVNNKH